MSVDEKYLVLKGSHDLAIKKNEELKKEINFLKHKVEDLYQLGTRADFDKQDWEEFERIMNKHFTEQFEETMTQLSDYTKERFYVWKNNLFVIMDNVYIWDYIVLGWFNTLYEFLVKVIVLFHSSKRKCHK